jgi:hypothetical protein
LADSLSGTKQEKPQDSETGRALIWVILLY